MSVVFSRNQWPDLFLFLAECDVTNLASQTKTKQHTHSTNLFNIHIPGRTECMYYHHHYSNHYDYNDKEQECLGFQSTMSWGNPCHVFKWKRLSASIAAHCQGKTQPSDPGKCAAHFLLDVAVVSLSWTGGLGRVFLSSVGGRSAEFHLYGCFGDVATGCGLQHMGSLKPPQKLLLWDNCTMN